MAEKRDFTFKVNSKGHAEGAEITYDYFRDMIVTLKGVDPGDVANMLTTEELVDLCDLKTILNALIAKHGTEEVVTVLASIPGESVFLILDILYDHADDEVRDWVTDHLGDND